MQRGLPIGSIVLNWINSTLDGDSRYLRLHHEIMQAKWHKYIECTSMRVGKLCNMYKACQTIKQHSSLNKYNNKLNFTYI